MLPLQVGWLPYILAPRRPLCLVRARRGGPAGFHGTTQLPWLPSNVVSGGRSRLKMRLQGKLYFEKAHSEPGQNIHCAYMGMYTWRPRGRKAGPSVFLPAIEALRQSRPRARFGS